LRQCKTDWGEPSQSHLEGDAVVVYFVVYFVVYVVVVAAAAYVVAAYVVDH
jgi:hypothetical protein